MVLSIHIVAFIPRTILLMASQIMRESIAMLHVLQCKGRRMRTKTAQRNSNDIVGISAPILSGLEILVAKLENDTSDRTLWIYIYRMGIGNSISGKGYPILCPMSPCCLTCLGERASCTVHVCQGEHTYNIHTILGSTALRVHMQFWKFHGCHPPKIKCADEIRA